jgi:hypothetical protein
MYDCRHPVDGTSGQPRIGRLPIVVRCGWRLYERGAVVEGVDIHDRAQAGRGIAHCADIDAAPPAEQIVGGPRAQTVSLDQRPVMGQTSNSPNGSERVRVLWARQKEQEQARNGLSWGALLSRKRVRISPQ